MRNSDFFINELNEALDPEKIAAFKKAQAERKESRPGELRQDVLKNINDWKKKMAEKRGDKEVGEFKIAKPKIPEARTDKSGEKLVLVAKAKVEIPGVTLPNGWYGELLDNNNKWKWFNIPDELKEFQAAILQVFSKLQNSGAMFDAGRQHPEATIMLAQKGNEGLHSPRKFTAENSLGVKKILQQEIFTGNRTKEEPQALPGNSTASISVYITDLNEEDGKQMLVDNSKRMAGRENRQKFKEMEIVKNFPIQANFESMNKSFKEIKRKILAKKDKLIKYIAGISGAAKNNTEAYYDAKKKIEDYGGVRIDLFINNKKEEEYFDSLRHYASSSTMHYSKFEDIYETLSMLKRDGVIKEDFLYFNY